MIDGLYSLLARMGFTDPLHAPFTHFPIGLIFGALTFFVVALVFQRKQLVLTARHASILAFVMSFPTILFGVIDWIHFFNGAMIAPIKAKMILASIVLVVLAAGIILGSEVKLYRWTTTILYVLAFLAVVGLGWFGAGLYPGTLRRNLAAAPAPSQPAAPAPSQPAAPAPGQPAAPAPSQPAAPAPSQPAAPAPSQPAAPAPSQASIQAGSRIFDNNCAGCHADGGNAIVANLALKTAPQLSSLQAFVQFIRTPRMRDGSAGAMPPFPPQTVSDADAANLYAYTTTMARTTWK